MIQFIPVCNFYGRKYWEIIRNATLTMALIKVVSKNKITKILSIIVAVLVGTLVSLFISGIAPRSNVLIVEIIYS